MRTAATSIPRASDVDLARTRDECIDDRAAQRLEHGIESPRRERIAELELDAKADTRTPFSDRIESPLPGKLPERTVDQVHHDLRIPLQAIARREFGAHYPAL